MITSSDIKRLAAEAGFDLCGITTADVIPDAVEQYHRWLAGGYHADMDWMATSAGRREDPSTLMDNVRSVVMLGVNYYVPNSPQSPAGHGRVSRHARGRDYHKVVGRMTESLIRRIRYEMDREVVRQSDAAGRFKWWVDYGPFLERAYAEKAGLGFIGKNSMLINRRFGSWIVLAEIVTSLELEPDHIRPGDHGRCGTCRRCIDACPAGAIIDEKTIDSRRCLSYWTIERHLQIPEEFAGPMGNRIFGCDTCQEVCPLNEKAVVTSHAALLPHSGLGEFIDAKQILNLRTTEEFLSLTAGTSLTRPKLEGLQRNARIVLANQESVR
ncbi:MAG: tRNA epoxyqueuosine(34) reductase QueG [candidate division Zixibacteria bacterium]|nr:tRNA epoxyqueuosine(34) reductase QueG [candidate division Zixibacteria bacterium]